MLIRCIFGYYLIRIINYFITSHNTHLHRCTLFTLAIRFCSWRILKIWIKCFLALLRFLFRPPKIHAYNSGHVFINSTFHIYFFFISQVIICSRFHNSTSLIIHRHTITRSISITHIWINISTKSCLKCRISSSNDIISKRCWMINSLLTRLNHHFFRRRI